MFIDFCSDLGRIDCAIGNALICDDDNQVIDYKRDWNGKCEQCIIRSMYQARMNDLASEWQMATDEKRKMLEDETLNAAKEDVGSTFENTQGNTVSFQQYHSGDWEDADQK